MVDGHPVEFDAYTPEYAEVYGVPFSFIPCSGSNTTPKPGLAVTHVRAIESRLACEITFPRLNRLPLRPANPSSFRRCLAKSPKWRYPPRTCLPKTEMSSIIGESDCTRCTG